jgi:hypothetical protein
MRLANKNRWINLTYCFGLLIFLAPHLVLSQPHHAVTDSINKTRLIGVAAAGTALYVGGMSFLGFVWYKDHKRVPFHFYNDLKGYHGMDKFGHAYAAYWESKVAFHALKWAGLDDRRALLWGAPVGFVFQLPIELFDGIYEGWGFSWWDVAANTTGSVLFAVQQAAFGQQYVTMKFSYSPSGYPKYHPILGETPIESFFLDYNGHTHWLSANLKSITGFDKIPPWLNLAFGFSANGMIKEFENPVWYLGKPFPHLERYSQFLLSLDLDLSKIPARRKGLRAALNALNMLKVPFPAIEFNRIDGIKLWGIYY